MPLPHYTQSRASSQRFEPIQPNLFEVTIFSPLGDDTGLILEQVNSIGGLNNLNPSVDAVGQKYKFADRSYAGMPSSTVVDLTVNFTLNLNEANENYIYNMVTLAIIIIVIAILIMLIKAEGFRKYSLILVLGGSLGNLFDRIYYSAVPDFIDFRINNFHWFVFNVADIFITLGIICLIFDEIFVNNNKNENLV